MVNLNEGRKGFEGIGNTYPVADDIIREDTIVAGVPCAWFSPSGADEDNIVIFIHGGAFIFGSVNSHAPMVSYIARELNRRVLVIDYRLAPEHPFPAAIDDCVSVINALYDRNPRVSFGIIGDSAGSSLTMSANLIINETNGPGPSYTILMSPWVDLECKNPSYERNKMTDIILARPYLNEAAKMYAPGWDLSTPVLSPVNGNFKGLAPVLILCGTREILEDDSVNLHRQLVANGVKSELKRFEGELHVWPFMDINTPASRNALNEMARFVARLAC